MSQKRSELSSEEADPCREDSPRPMKFGPALAIGIGAGTALGVALGSIAIGIGLGVGVAAAFTTANRRGE